ncbi:2-keto-4-pentenoate hydratase [Micromonospora globispora]|uniref:2-keto-4-pentenoate hydratase n=1 Tax=Micromonospora globispora TaxID=1450148 RepID=UPI000D6F6286|nr:2-keto-4-pentenoate hydratase [Micromonospora globispora]PWU55470.1 2-keto-4-pentenoate hydratase [Micromonospora globispora]RQW91869.1 2-keto-4-pentenoate hydratase [Micromonospora globispora]
MDAAERRAAAESLLGAYRGQPIGPLTQTYRGITPEDAYVIQQLQVERWKADGRVIKGHKVGLTARVMQRQLGVDQPDYGHLMDNMIVLEGQPLRMSDFVSPKVEPEIAFVLGSSVVGPGVTVPDAISAVDYVLPALEIIDSRIADWRITLADTIADNASSGAVVLGSRPVRLGDLDLRLTGCVLSVDGQVVGTGAGGAVLGSPIHALAWLANTLGRLGVGLEAGQVVIPGSLTAAHPLAPGSVVTATFAHLGTLTTRMERVAQ